MKASRVGRGAAVVTGGSAGVGRAITRELARIGYDVAVIARGEQALDDAVEDVRGHGRRGLAVVADVADADAVEAAAGQVEAELGPVSVWVNNAMSTVFGEFLDVEPPDYERATAVTYLGTVNGTRAALRRMLGRERGHVVQVGSALAYRGIPLQSAYCGAKHAIVGFTESVITELRHHDSPVKVSMVHLPALNTPQFSWARSLLPYHPQPVRPIYQPAVGARMVGHVVEHPRRSTWVAPPTVFAVLANRLAPRLLDRRLAGTGYQDQLLDGVSPARHADNLYTPVPGDPGAEGIFGKVSRARSAQAWADRHRRSLVGVGTLFLAGVTATIARSRLR